VKRSAIVKNGDTGEVNMTDIKITSESIEMAGELEKQIEAWAADRYRTGTELFDKFQKGRTGSFYTLLFQAMKIADDINLQRLSLGFPGEVCAFKAWKFGDEGEYQDGEGLL
jgi:hypothetical protein